MCKARLAAIEKNHLYMTVSEFVNINTAFYLTGYIHIRICSNNMQLFKFNLLYWWFQIIFISTCITNHDENLRLFCCTTLEKIWWFLCVLCFAFVWHLLRAVCRAYNIWQKRTNIIFHSYLLIMHCVASGNASVTLKSNVRLTL